MNCLITENWFKKHNISLIICVVLLVSQVASNYVTWVILVIYFGFQIIRKHGKIVFKRFLGNNILSIMVLTGMIIGIINISTGSVKVWPFMRDIIHFSSIPLICWCFSNMAEKNNFDLEVLYHTAFFFCGIYSLIVTVLAIPNYLTAGSNFYEFVSTGIRIRESVLSIGLYLTFFKPKGISRIYISRNIDRLLSVTIIVAVLLSFSRTTILLFMCLCVIGFARHIKSVMKIVVIIAFGILLVAKIFPGIVESYGEKIVHSFQEVSSSQNVWNDTSIVQNWRGYEVYCAKREYNSYSLPEQIFGKGFGATIDVGNYAYLVTSEDKLPYLHNGYYTTLIKSGALGIALVVFYWISLLYSIKKSHTGRYEKELNTGIVIGMALSMFFIHGVFWGGNEEIFYLFLVWINMKNTDLNKKFIGIGEGKVK